MNTIEQLQRNKEIQETIHQNTMARYGNSMQKQIKAINNAKYRVSSQYYSNAINREMAKEQDKMIDSIVNTVMDRISIEVKDEASKPISEINKEIDKLIKK